MEQKAEECKAKAEKELSKFFGGSAKQEKARELFRQAGNYYKASEMWEPAAAAYQRAQELSRKLKEEPEMQDDMMNVANCLTKANAIKESRPIYESIIQMHLERGKNAEAAKLCNQLGQTCEAQKDTEGAMFWYKKASQYYKRESSHQTARNIEIKIANMLALQGNYNDAIEIFVQLGREYVTDPLLRLNARHQFFLACLCHVAKIMPEGKDEGIDTLEESFQEYTMTDPVFTVNTWEYKLIQGIIDTFRDNDLEALREIISEYEQVNTVDELKAKLLLRAKDVLKKSIQDER